MKRNGEHGCSLVTPLLGDPDRSVRERAMVLVERISSGREEVVQKLAAISSSADAEVARQRCLEWVARLGWPETSDLVRKMLDDPVARRSA